MYKNALASTVSARKHDNLDGMLCESLDKYLPKLDLWPYTWSQGKGKRTFVSAAMGSGVNSQRVQVPNSCGFWLQKHGV